MDVVTLAMNMYSQGVDPKMDFSNMPEVCEAYEKFTGMKGAYVPLDETVRGFREILDGKHDALPESAFLFVGTIDEAVEKAKQSAEANA